MQIIPKSSIFHKIQVNSLDNFMVGLLFGFASYILLYSIIVLVFRWLKKPLSKKGQDYVSASTASVGITIFLGIWLSSATFSILISLVSFAALLMPWAHKLHL